MARPTTEQIRALRDEATSHGDTAMAIICTEALKGDEEAIEECAIVIWTAAIESIATDLEPEQVARAQRDALRVWEA
jgi:hypothetical protein